MSYPKCFPNEHEHQVWLKFKAASDDRKTATVCFDCTPEYRTKMAFAHRCNQAEATELSRLTYYKKVTS